LLHHNFCWQQAYTQHGQEEDDTPVSDLSSSSTYYFHTAADLVVVVLVVLYYFAGRNKIIMHYKRERGPTYHSSIQLLQLLLLFHKFCWQE
jgi:hypothetical protein